MTPELNTPPVANNTHTFLTKELNEHIDISRIFTFCYEHINLGFTSAYHENFCGTRDAELHTDIYLCTINPGIPHCTTHI